MKKNIRERLKRLEKQVSDNGQDYIKLSAMIRMLCYHPIEHRFVKEINHLNYNGEVSRQIFVVYCGICNKEIKELNEICNEYKHYKRKVETVKYNRGSRCYMS